MGFRRNRRVPDQLNMLATKDNDGATFNANVDYSSEAAEYKIKPPSGQMYVLARMLVHIFDNGLLSASGYGVLSALTNGVKMKYIRSGITHYLIPVLTPVHTNADWAGQCFDVEYSPYGAGNDNYWHVRWSYYKNGAPIELNGNKGDELIIDLNDSFVGIIEHWFRFGGIFYTI